MEEIIYGVIVCEKCYQIPEITIVNKKKVQIKCPKCNDTKMKDYSYFEKFMINIQKESWTNLPKCKNHEAQTVEYCFKCRKYLCDECIKIHNASFEDKNHIFIKQTIDTQYYCDKKGHEEYILDQYCTQCNVYLCNQCKCDHQNSEHIYDFGNKEKDNIIKQVLENVRKCEQIIEDEEKKLNNFIDEVEKKINAIKNMFKDYKERNQKIISIYKLLINNYKYFNSIRNYNINNNIIINNNFDLTTSEDFIKKKNANECLNARYNRLYSFYSHKQHITTKEYINHFITKKFCSKNIIKKCVIIHNNLIVFIFSNDNHIYYLCDKKIIEKHSFSNIIKDIYPLNLQQLLVILADNQTQIYNIENTKSEYLLTKLKKKINSNFIIPNLLDNNNVFIISNNKKIFSIYYYYKNNNNDRNISLIYKENKNYNINCIFDKIIEIITNSKINLEEENKLKNLFIERNNININKLITIDDNLLNINDNLIMNFYKNNNKFNENNNNNEFIINSNYVYYIIKNKMEDKAINLNIEEINKINYILRLVDVCHQIRTKYIWYIVLNTKINNVYNVNNEYLIFMGEKYFFAKYLLKEKEFIPLITGKFIENDKDNINNYEINYICQNYIVLNNFKEKIINFIDINIFSFLNKKFTYYLNLVANDNYLLFDNINDNELLFSLINLSDLSNEKNNNLSKYNK